MRIRITGGMVLILVAAIPATTVAQQKGQYILGTYGLNAGIQPAPGFSYGNQATFFWAGRLKGGSTYGAVFDLVTANAFGFKPEFGAPLCVEGTTIDLRGSHQLPCHEMNVLPKTRYSSSAFIPPACLTALGSLASASAARAQCLGVDRVQPDRGD
jgi:hypothetical protein